MPRQGFDGGEPGLSLGLSDTIQNLLVSGVRLSAGITLYGIERIQKVVEAATGERGLPGAVAELDSALGVLANLLEGNLDDTKREALRSVSRVSAKAVEKAFDALNPTPVLRAVGRLTGGRDATPPAAPATPTLAVDMLSGPADT
jgi:hypothetical protein